MVQSEPLAQHRVMRTSDLDEARLRIGQALSRHRLEPIGPDQGLDTRFNFIRYGDIGLAYLSYGCEVRVRPEPTTDFHVVQIPLTGRADVRSGGDEVTSSPEVASVPDPDVPLDIRSYAGNAHLIVRIDRAALSRHLLRMLGREPATRLRLAPAMQLTTSPALSWLATVRLLQNDAQASQQLRHPMLQPHIEQLMMTQLLMGVPNNFSEQLVGDSVRTPAPRPIRRAEQLIVERAREPLTVGEIAQAVGLPVRSLQEGFRRYLDTTPLARLREARLAGAHAELVAADPTTTTVARVAAAWGFWHLGRFAITYRKRWGVSPSETLRS